MPTLLQHLRLRPDWGQGMNLRDIARVTIKRSTAQRLVTLTLECFALAGS